MSLPHDMILANLDQLREFLRELREQETDDNRRAEIDGHLASVDDAEERIIVLSGR